MTFESARDLPKAGFQFILDDIEARAKQSTSLRITLDDILSLGGRQSLTRGLQSLTAKQAAFYETGIHLPFHADASGITDPQSDLWHIGISSYGRIWLSNALPDSSDYRIFGHTKTSTNLLDEITAKSEKIRQAWQQSDAEMHAFFSKLDNTTLQNVLYEVHEAIDHTDPVLLFIGDHTLSNFGKFNNLQERNGADLPHCFFRRAQQMALSDWTHEEKIFVFCFYWLRMAGCRGEEFNCKQLNPALLRTYLDQRLSEFREKTAQSFEGAAESIEEKAKLLARYKATCTNDLLTYRWVNGLNLYKEERLFPRSQLKYGIQTLPSELHTYLAETYGIDAGSYDTLKDLFDTCIARMAETNFISDDPDLNDFEKLLKTIVDCAIEATHSDVGMSRGFRDIQRWHHAFVAQDYATICDWPSGDHYCGVFPSKAFQSKFKNNPEMLIKILYACSGRMQFNSWHYTPGHCPRESVPKNRHFYLPPRMPDTAIWSDQHHAGHVLAEVRYSIRSPAPINVEGRIYPGLVDLRLFRQRGEPYTDQELFQAITYTDYVRALYQALSDYILQTGKKICIEAFDKDWYKRFYKDRLANNISTSAPPSLSDQKAAPSHADSKHPSVMSELFRLLHSHAQNEKIALIEARHLQPETSLSYRALLAQTLALRNALQKYHITPGSCIALWSQQPLHQTIAIVAGIANGVIINPINPSLSETMLEGQLRHAKPALLITDGSTPLPETLSLAAFNSMQHVDWNSVFDTATDFDTTAAEAALASVHTEGNKQAGLLIYTSGTTGQPKGVLLGWNHIEANVRFAINTLGYQAGWIAGSMLPRFHTFTLISDIFPALFLGGCAILTDTFELPRSKSIVEAFRRHGVQSYSAAPIILEAWCGLRAWSNMPSLRFAVAGAAPLKEKTRLAYSELFKHPIIPCYGLSETTCFAAISPPDDIRPGTVGKPAGIEICILDEHQNTVSNGITGELAMRGPSVISSGYFHDTEGRFAHAFTEDGWFLTGDVGRLNQDGYVYVTGRKKNMVIRGGEKIYLEDVDRCVFDYLGVVDCASIVQCEAGLPDLALTFIVTADSKTIPQNEIDAHIKKTLTPKHVPDRVYFIERVPRTPSGKASHPELLTLAHHLNNQGESR